jgi:hypothetical protein
VRGGLEHLARDPFRFGLAQRAALVEHPLAARGAGLTA